MQTLQPTSILSWKLKQYSINLEHQENRLVKKYWYCSLLSPLKRWTIVRSIKDAALDPLGAPRVMGGSQKEQWNWKLQIMGTNLFMMVSNLICFTQADTRSSWFVGTNFNVFGPVSETFFPPNTGTKWAIENCNESHSILTAWARKKRGFFIQLAQGKRATCCRFL